MKICKSLLVSACKSVDIYFFICSHVRLSIVPESVLAHKEYNRPVFVPYDNTTFLLQSGIDSSAVSVQLMYLKQYIIFSAVVSMVK